MQGKKIKEISYRKNKTQKRHFSSESVHFQPTIFNSIFLCDHKTYPELFTEQYLN